MTHDAPPSLEPRRKRIAVIPGDGVGPEVMHEALKVLAVVNDQDGAGPPLLSFDSLDWGTRYYHRTGDMMPADGLDRLRAYDAILFGAVGSPDVPDHVTLRRLLLRIRFAFDQYINLRPSRLLPGVVSPIGLEPPFEVTVIREGVEGEYIGLGNFIFEESEREIAFQTSVFTRQGVERVMRWAFELARASGRSLTSVSKGNALQYTGVLWDRVFREVAADFPEVRSRNLLVDAAALLLVRDPRSFQVVVASNLFADILTDLAAGLVGGLGIAPSASLNPTGAFPSTFEPVHGSAPDIAGQGIANPIGMIWSAALMLQHLGYDGWATSIVAAIESVIANPALRPRDLGGTATTAAIGDAVAATVARLQPGRPRRAQDAPVSNVPSGSA